MQCVTSHALGLFHACNRGHYVDMGGSLCGTPVAVFHEALRPDTASASMQCMQLYKQPHARHHQTKHAGRVYQGGAASRHASVADEPPHRVGSFASRRRGTTLGRTEAYDVENK